MHEGGIVAGVTVLSKLKIPERLFLGFLCYLTAGSFLIQLEWRQRFVVVALNGLVAAVIFVVGRYGNTNRSRFVAGLRVWIPSALILVAYRESGLFFTPDPSHHLDYFFIQYDDVILKHSWVLAILHGGAPWIQYYLEFSYFLCYPIVPLGVACLYFLQPASTLRLSPAGKEILQGGSNSENYGSALELFWTAVLLASFTCYVLFPFFPLAPPRELFNDVPGPRVAPLLRALNHWLLGKYAVGASLFPSAHVAATTAMALVIRHYLPRLGWVFLFVAVSIALATVYGRYHYGVDAAAGALVGVAAYFVSRRLVKSS